MDDQNNNQQADETVVLDGRIETPEEPQEVVEEAPIAEETTEDAPEQDGEAEAPGEETQVQSTPDEYDTEVANEMPVDDRELEDDSDAPIATSISERGSGSKKLSGHIIISKTEDPKAHWFVVHSSSGHEARVAESLRQRVETMKLENKVFEVLIPTQDTIKVKQGKKYTVKEKIFPGYILVKLLLDEDAWLAVRTTPGITGFVGIGNKPTPLSELEVQNITKFVSSPAARYKVKFSVGEAVKITDGPFIQQLATISQIDEEKGRVQVLVSIFGRETPVELDFLQIAKI